MSVGARSSKPLKRREAARMPNMTGQTDVRPCGCKWRRWPLGSLLREGSGGHDFVFAGVPRFFLRFEEFPGEVPTREVMADPRTDRSELTSINQLIQDIIGGSVRRHTFTQWELELLLDLQTCG